MLLGGCGRIGFAPVELVQGDAAQACASFGPWSAPVQITALTSPATDWSPALSPDGTLLLFETLRENDMADIYGAVRSGIEVADPQPVAKLTSGAIEESPAWSADGTEVYFDRFTTDYELMVATYDGASFGTPRSIELFGSGATISSTGLEMFFNTMPFPQDLRRATRASTTSAWMIADTLESLNTAGLDGYPSLSADGLTLYFESDRSGITRIWQATRPAIGGDFGDPQVVAEFAESGVEYGDPDVSADGLTMQLATTATGDFEIYVATRACL